MSIKKEFTFKGCYMIENTKSDYKQIMEEYLLEYLKSIYVKEQETYDNRDLQDS